VAEPKLTLIVIPHGSRQTRTHEISYRKLKVVAVMAFSAIVAIAVMAASWWYMVAQTARIPGLERELASRELERSQVVELARTLEDVEAQYERVRQLLGADGVGGDRPAALPSLRNEASTISLPLASDANEPRPDVWPLTFAGYITRTLVRNDDQSHPGLDIAVPQDSYIRSAGPGFVADAGNDSIYGLYVLIRHPGGYETMYGHASQLFVVPGDTVESREVIGLSGSTGRSTAPHLHFEVRKDGLPVDPVPVVRRPGGY